MRNFGSWQLTSRSIRSEYSVIPLESIAYMNATDLMKKSRFYIILGTVVAVLVLVASIIALNFLFSFIAFIALIFLLILLNKKSFYYVVCSNSGDKIHQISSDSKMFNDGYKMFIFLILEYKFRYSQSLLNKRQSENLESASEEDNKQNLYSNLEYLDYNFRQDRDRGLDYINIIILASCVIFCVVFYYYLKSHNIIS